MSDIINGTEKISQLSDFFKKNINSLSKDIKWNMNKYKVLGYHYTSLLNMFNILENDTLWFSNLHFTNDSSEERTLGEKWIIDNKYNSDNFIFCVSDKNDTLSQWRGYCKDGGVSIGFDIVQPYKYFVLYADFNESKKCENIYSAALPVLYTPKKLSEETIEEGAKFIVREIKEKLRENFQYTSLCINDFVPYIKHYAFNEEQERRILFSNTNGELSECIRFRLLPNGMKIPYIVVKCSYVGESDGNPLNMSKEQIEEIIEDRVMPKSVVIPKCQKQAELCNLVREHIKKNLKKEIRVFCDGHLPVRRINIGPMPENNRIKEQVEYYCKSKYWLKDVKVSVSDIPYVSSMYS